MALRTRGWRCIFLRTGRGRRTGDEGGLDGGAFGPYSIELVSKGSRFFGPTPQGQQRQVERASVRQSIL